MNAKPILVISLLANLALAGGMVWSVKSAKSRVHAERVAAAEKAQQVAQAKSATDQEAAAATTATPEPQKASQSFDWRLVESEDYKKYIANLRSIGCPEETIKDIIMADVTKLFDSRRRALKGSNTNKFEYWKAGQNFFAGMMDEEKIQKSAELAKEKRALLKELLGTVPDEKPDMFAGANPFESLLDFLPAGKQSEVMDVMMKYQAKMAKSLGNGAPDAEDMKKLRASQKEMEAELAKVMTPEELDAYQLRLSNTSMMMRMQLASFDPSEQEFKDIFKLKKAYDDEYTSMFGAPLNQSKEEKAKQQAAEKELKEQLKTLLGEDRYKDYERAQDWAYQGIYKTAERNGLGKEEANKVYDMKKIAEDQAMKVRNDKNLSSEQRTAALAGIRAETEKSIQDVFGPKGWQSYQNQQTAYWLNGISPKKE